MSPDETFEERLHRKRRHFLVDKVHLHNSSIGDTVPDALDEYLQMGAETAHEVVGFFYKCASKILERDHGPNPFILLEDVASHAFFGVSGANNGNNMVNQSPLFNDLKERKAPDVSFVANSITYPWRYYLVDEIYSELSTFVKDDFNVS
ncbi:ALP1-like protein [Tanacetum coccineum]